MNVKTLKQYTSIDKREWSRSPWDDEPDKVQFDIDGMPALAVRAPMGNWCGYVGVTREHRAYGVEYSDAALGDVCVHGGLTFSERCHPGPESRSICHVPQPGESDDVWWFGFDCAHAFDRRPGMPTRYADLYLDGTYRDLAYVTAEIVSLAAQLQGTQS